MAKYTNDELLEAFGEMTLVELSEFVKAFEEKFDVEAAAPAAVAVAAPALALLLRKRRTSSTSSSPPLATRRSRSSRPSALSPPWVWLRPRLWSTALRRLSWRRPRRKTLRRLSPSSKKPALPSSSSDSRGLKPHITILSGNPVRHKAAGFSAYYGFSFADDPIKSDLGMNASISCHTMGELGESCQLIAS